MATITAQQIIDKVEIILQDSTNVRWAESELLGWLNDGQREIVLLRPESYAKNESKQMTAGTKQALPATGVMLIDVVRNMGVNGSTAGNAVRVVTREIMDSQNPAWHAETPAAAIKHFMFDPRDPKNFYVYPPSDGTTYIEIVYAAAPTDVNAVGNTITLDDIYMGPLIDYILYRAYSKDAEFAANATLASAHYQMFTNALTAKGANIMANNPNISTTPFNPNVPGGAK